MKALRLLPLAGLCLAVGFPLAGICADKVEIRQDFSKTLVYKNSWTSQYFSKRADVIDKDKETGTVDVSSLVSEVAGLDDAIGALERVRDERDLVKVVLRVGSGY